jgi:hypothetical protein
MAGQPTEVDSARRLRQVEPTRVTLMQAALPLAALTQAGLPQAIRLLSLAASRYGPEAFPAAWAADRPQNRRSRSARVPRRHQARRESLWRLTFRTLGSALYARNTRGWNDYRPRAYDAAFKCPWNADCRL